ncbi:Hypothetical predicted protein [Podarcis lilfordi]|uniref:Uncharacterized protein n=1 Tax=Podarcis lilfordi TaxID=74358 RepID=A0AA35JT21_9SAUR|nr:Hypothetical predicted protein [Podarcis lilfordi]
MKGRAPGDPLTISSGHNNRGPCNSCGVAARNPIGKGSMVRLRQRECIGRHVSLQSPAARPARRKNHRVLPVAAAGGASRRKGLRFVWTRGGRCEALVGQIKSESLP